MVCVHEGTPLLKVVDEIREQYARHRRAVRAGLRHWSAESAELSKGYTNADGGPTSTKPTPASQPGPLTIPSGTPKVPDWLGVDHFAAHPRGVASSGSSWGGRRRGLWGRTGTAASGGAKEYGEGRSWRSIANETTTTPTGNVLRQAAGHGAVRPPSPVTPATAPPHRTNPPRRRPDPFGGTGTTAMVARILGRYPVHLDLSADYLKLACWRIYESGHASQDSGADQPANDRGTLPVIARGPPADRPTHRPGRRPGRRVRRRRPARVLTANPLVMLSLPDDEARRLDAIVAALRLDDTVVRVRQASRC